MAMVQELFKPQESQLKKASLQARARLLLSIVNEQIRIKRNFHARKNLFTH